ncbi:MAG: threonylcarbamoyl-AMP synthase [Oscillospiraceae bacterium]|nr:threonylcarbamoyl-AMP synthase [Oscillospiraceae bacterium]
MITRLLTSSDEDIAAAARIIREGGIVGMPTETVYGLAGNALDADSSRKIYAAKGRPSDNPLIVHIADIADISPLVKTVPDNARRLFDTFSPGPLTVILPKTDIIPDATSGGLDTVGIRIPADRTARRLIRAAGVPIAAPSANRSGSPSPTTAAHVMHDMDGRIPAVIDGGGCAVGVESTVVSCSEDGHITILRPGFVSLEDIASVTGEDGVSLAKGVTERISDGERVLSPGMKYRHYAPDADIALVVGGKEAFERFVSAQEADAYAAGFGDESLPRLIPYGLTSEEQAHELFDMLRRIDEIGAKRVYVRCPERSGVGLAVYNRLLRAAGFEVIYA